MDFYTALSTYYDEIFAVSQSDLTFVNSFIPPSGRVLDVGCGTGNKTVFLNSANNDASIAAIDLDTGMIDYAHKYHARAHIPYQQLDMRHIAQQFGSNSNSNSAGNNADSSAQNGSFDTVLCLGNTLVHLPKSELGPFLHAVKAVLRTGGSCVLQILNYDRILDNNISQLPVIETAHTTFTRRYTFVDHAMHFCTSITLRATGESVDNDIILYPLRKQALEDLLSAAGFRNMSWYGSFAGAALKEDSFVSIVHCVA